MIDRPQEVVCVGLRSGRVEMMPGDEITIEIDGGASITNPVTG